MKNIIISVFIVCLILSLPAWGQVKKGQVGFRFLENPVSAEAIGRGGLGLVQIRNANTVFWNPAGLGWIPGKFDFTLNYTKGIADINHSTIAGAAKLWDIGYIAIDFISMDYGDFYGTRRADNDQGFEDTGTFSPQAFAIGVSFGQKVSDRFSYGVKIKYAKQDLGSAWIGLEGTDVDDPALVIGKKDYAKGEMALDVGAIYDFFYHKIRFGAAIQNISREIKYEEEKFPLPFAASFSLMLDPVSLIMQSEEPSPFTLGFESRHPRDFREKYKIGGEYNLLDLLLIRAGYMGNYDERGLTFGLGVNQTLTNLNFRVDYAYQDFGVFNAVHLFSFGANY